MEQYGIGFKEIAKYGIILESYRILEYLIAQGVHLVPLSSYHLDYDWYLYTDSKRKIDIAVAVSQGSPMAVDLAERYASSGINTIVRIGTTGSLVDGLKLGEVVIPYAAIRDEGTSGFYIHKNAPAIADITLSQKIAEKLRRSGKVTHHGISWSTDGRWRETDEMVKEYSDSGAIAADMESSALFAFGLQKKINIASVSVLSDEIHKDEGDGPKGLSDKEVWFNLVLPAFRMIFDILPEVFSESD